MAIKKVLSVACLILGASLSATAEVRYSVQGSGYIYEAVDGDTVWLSDVEPLHYRTMKTLSGDPDHFRDRYRSVKMRVFGINTAESEHREKWRNTAEGKRASAFLSQRINKRQAKYHCWDIGDYNRPICSVSVDGFGDIGQQMILSGYSRYITYFGEHPFNHRAYVAADTQ